VDAEEIEKEGILVIGVYDDLCPICQTQAEPWALHFEER
jgi:hypothetical protein